METNQIRIISIGLLLTVALSTTISKYNEFRNTQVNSNPNKTVEVQQEVVEEDIQYIEKAKASKKARPNKSYEEMTSKFLDIPLKDVKKLKVSDYATFWLPKVKAANSAQRRKIYKDPNYRASYIAFFIDDIYVLRKSKQAGTISLALAQADHESMMGTSTLGANGNHFGIKGSLKFGSGKRAVKDDHPWKSSFGTSSAAGWASFEQYFTIVRNQSKDIDSEYNPHKAHYARYAWAIQRPYSEHKACSGRGCRSCKYLGIKGSVYATMKFPGKKANPASYTDIMIKHIEKHEWDRLDVMTLVEIKQYIDFLYKINK